MQYWETQFSTHFAIQAFKGEDAPEFQGRLKTVSSVIMSASKIKAEERKSNARARKARRDNPQKLPVVFGGMNTV